MNASGEHATSRMTLGVVRKQLTDIAAALREYNDNTTKLLKQIQTQIDNVHEEVLVRHIKGCTCGLAHATASDGHASLNQ